MVSIQGQTKTTITFFSFVILYCFLQRHAGWRNKLLSIHKWTDLIVFWQTFNGANSRNDWTSIVNVFLSYFADILRGYAGDSLFQLVQRYAALITQELTTDILTHRSRTCNYVFDISFGWCDCQIFWLYYHRVAAANLSLDDLWRDSLQFL